MSDTRDGTREGWVYSEPTNGIIARIVPDRGFAFIRAGQTDYFMHHSDYNGEFLSLKEQMRVLFTPAQTPKGPRACLVEKDTK